MATSTNQNRPSFTFGTDPPASSATKGYNLNHTCLIVNDLEASRHFYGTILGMREISHTQFTEDFSGTYFGYPSCPDQHETGKEMWETARNRSGLLQLLHMRSAAVPRAPGGPKSTFSHLGLFVPDVGKVRDRMREFGVRILKDVGEAGMEMGDVAAAFGGDGTEHDEKMVKAVAAMGAGLGKVLLVADPDGNVVEFLE